MQGEACCLHSIPNPDGPQKKKSLWHTNWKTKPQKSKTKQNPKQKPKLEGLAKLGDGLGINFSLCMSSPHSFK